MKSAENMRVKLILYTIDWKDFHKSDDFDKTGQLHCI